MLDLRQMRHEYLDTAPNRLTLDSVQLRENRDFGITFDPMLLCLADYIRLREQDGDSGVGVPTELHFFNGLAEELHYLAGASHRWSSLSGIHLKLLAFERILHYALTNDHREIDAIGRLYRVLVRRLSEHDRMILLSDIFAVLRSNDRELNALMTFMFHDPSLAVVSTASMSFACLHPVTDDPMAGPKACMHLADTYADNDEAMRIGIWQGVLLLGDRRALPLLDGCWRSLSDEGKGLLSQAWSDMLTAAVISFWIRWLDDVSEDEYGYAAGALARLPIQLSGTLVEDVERRFPAPFPSSIEEHSRNPPITVLEQWTIEEYGRLLEPHLRLLLVEETYDRVIPRVLDAWDIEMGPLTEDRQLSRALSIYMKRFDRLRASVQDALDKPEEAHLPEDRAKRLIAVMLRDHSAGTALLRCDEVAAKMPEFAATRLRNALALDAGPRRDEAMANAELFRLQGVAMRRLLTRQFGADLETEALIVMLFEQRGHGYLFEPWHPRLKLGGSRRKYPDTSRELE
jgi:hypothetical protein